MPLISGGRGSFNGGTITTPLILAMTDPANVPLQCMPPAGASAAQTPQLQVFNDGGSPVAAVDALGQIYCFPGTNGGFGFHANNANAVTGDNGSVGAQLETGKSLIVQSAQTSNSLLEVREDNRIGLFGHAVAAQQALASGTATPELIALALQANGFCGGT